MIDLSLSHAFWTLAFVTAHAVPVFFAVAISDRRRAKRGGSA